jgi:hypothetical protein
LSGFALLDKKNAKKTIIISFFSKNQSKTNPVRYEICQKDADKHSNKRQFMDAMVAFNTDKNTKNYALNKGFFVIEPSGDDVKVTKPEGEVGVW